MKVKKSTTPPDSLTRKYIPADYTDAYSCEVESAHNIVPDDIMVWFWTRTASAGWVRALFRLRNFLVRFVGLKGSDNMNGSEFEAAIRGGGSYGLMSIAAKNPHETVMLLTDKHLDAWLSIHVDGNGTSCKTISVITVVRFKNRLGRLYFFVIRPFHALVVQNLLARAIKKIT